MASPELDGLIIDHLADIDASVKRLNGLEREVFEALMEKIRTWSHGEGWVGDYDYIETGCWVAPPDWRTPETEPDKDDFLAYFEMAVGAGDTESQKKPDEDYFYLTRLCGVGTGRIGFRFKQEVVPKGAWRRRLRDHAPTISDTAFLADTEPSFFLSFRIDPTELAAAVRQEEIEGALDEPIMEVLRQLAAAKPAFDKVLMDLKLARSNS